MDDYVCQVMIPDLFDPKLKIKCGKPIRVMAYKGTGCCGEAHRKIRDGDISEQQKAVSP